MGGIGIGTQAPDDVVHFNEAIAWFRERDPITDEEFDQLVEAERDFAFHVAGASNADVVKQVWEAIDRAVKDGTPFDDFKDEVGDALVRSWGEEIPGRIETIFRTNVQTAYGAGRYQLLTKPAVKKARPYWQFNAIEDSRISDICDACDGTILPADDPWWATHQPPLHFNCRSTIRALTAEEAGDEGVDDDGPESDADDGFGGIPNTTGTKWEPDPSDYPEKIGDHLAKTL